MPPPASDRPASDHPGLDHLVLLIDGEAIVIDKPAGLPVDRPRDGSASIEDALQSLRFGFGRAPTPVHRLDRDTSGCLLLARNPGAHRRFAAAFAAGSVAKVYVAVLDGVPDATCGRVALPLAKRSTREAGWRMVADAQGKAAVTEWSVLGVAAGRALVALRPQTGRTHQLRVHAATGIGLAIVGDPTYGSGGRDEGRGMLLHALTLAVPRDGKPAIVARAPLPERFAPWAAFVTDEADAAI